MKISAAGTTVVPCTAIGDKVIGVLQNQPKQGQQADLIMLGISKVRVGASNVSADDLISTDSTGRAATYVAGTTGTSSFMIGRILAVDNATNAGGVATALINVLSMARGQ